MAKWSNALSRPKRPSPSLARRCRDRTRTSLHDSECARHGMSEIHAPVRRGPGSPICPSSWRWSAARSTPIGGWSPACGRRPHRIGGSRIEPARFGSSPADASAPNAPNIASHRPTANPVFTSRPPPSHPASTGHRARAWNSPPPVDRKRLRGSRRAQTLPLPNDSPRSERRNSSRRIVARNALFGRRLSLSTYADDASSGKTSNTARPGQQFRSRTLLRNHLGTG